MKKVFFSLVLLSSTLILCTKRNAVPNPLLSPKLISSGSEGIRQSHEIEAGKVVNLEVLFVDWGDKQVPSGTNNFDALWSKISSGNKLINSFKDKGVTVNVNLNKQWIRMPNLFASYFPANEGWDWPEYTSNAAALLAVKPYSANSIAIVVPNEGVEGFTCPSGAHSISYNGIRRMITLSPDVYDEHYTTLMHEIGHCYGSDELYPASAPYLHEVAGYDLMGDIVYATGFIGYHQWRYGWNTTEKIQLLYQKGSYTIELKKMSSTTGKNMIVIPDKTKTDKLWIIEIGQDVVSRAQFKAGRGEKMNAEGDRLILYTVEDPVESGKRAIRLVPRRSFDANQGTTKWLDDASFVAGQSFSKPDIPFSFKVNTKSADGFNITVSVEDNIPYSN